MKNLFMLGTVLSLVLVLTACPKPRSSGADPSIVSFTANPTNICLDGSVAPVLRFDWEIDPDTVPSTSVNLCMNIRFQKSNGDSIFTRSAGCWGGEINTGSMTFNVVSEMGDSPPSSFIATLRLRYGSYENSYVDERATTIMTSVVCDQITTPGLPGGVAN